MKGLTPWTALGFLVGLAMGCTTAAIVAQEDAPPPEISTVDLTKTGAVVPLENATVLYTPNGKASIHKYVTGKEAFFGRLEMAAGGKVPEHRDPTEEYIYILQGSGTLTLNDSPHEAKPGTLIYMPAGSKVSYQNGPEKLVAIQVFANPGPEAKYNQWSPTKP